MSDKMLANLLLGFLIFISVVLTSLACLIFKVDLIYVISVFSFIYAFVSFFSGFLSDFIYNIYVYFNERDFDVGSFNFDYYREIIDKYSISNIVLCYGKVDYRDELVCILLKLILDKKICISDGSLKIVSDEGLNQSETMLVKLLMGVKVYGKNVALDVHDDNVTDSLDCDLFCVKRGISVENIYFKVLCFGFFLVVIELLLVIFSSYIYSDDFSVFILFGIAVMLVYSVSYLSYKCKRIVVRGEKGIEVRKKLFGLKRYLKDFSNIDDKSIKELGLWEYYMIYAVIFNIKGNLNKEANEIYKNYISPYI